MTMAPSRRGRAGSTSWTPGAVPLDMRAEWGNERGAVLAPAFGRRRKRLRDLDLIVGLAEDVLSRRWWRGVATLSALCAMVAVIAPSPFEPLPAAPVDRVGSAEAI